MKVSILPLLVLIVFIFCIGIARRAKLNQSINVAEARSVYTLLLAFLAWTVIVVVLGIPGDPPFLGGTHTATVAILRTGRLGDGWSDCVWDPPKWSARHSRQHPVALAGLCSSIAHWGDWRCSEGDPGRNHIRFRFLDRHTGLSIRPIRPGRRMAVCCARPSAIYFWRSGI